MLDKILKVKKSSQEIFRIFLEYRISIDERSRIYLSGILKKF